MFSCTGLIIAVTFCVVLLCHFCEEKWRFSCKNIHTTSVEGVWSKDFFADDQIIHLDKTGWACPPLTCDCVTQYSLCDNNVIDLDNDFPLAGESLLQLLTLFFPHGFLRRMSFRRQILSVRLIPWPGDKGARWAECIRSSCFQSDSRFTLQLRCKT